MIGCPSCGAENVEGTRFCVKCGTTLPSSPPPESWRQSGDLGQQQTKQDYQPGGGYSSPQTPPSAYPSYTPQDSLSAYQQPGGAPDWQALGANKKLAAGLCGILLGSLGVHKFILGYTTEGVIMLLITVLTCGFGAIVTYVIGIIEGITYLTKSDEEFVRTYIQNKKGWF
ncbi:MAG TPA: TM2 domain-containing protein [Pyrinomonadaceae bacterium]|jgi:TM2 domain-containing membrane protein YozV